MMSAPLLRVAGSLRISGMVGPVSLLTVPLFLGNME